MAQALSGHSNQRRWFGLVLTLAMALPSAGSGQSPEGIVTKEKERAERESPRFQEWLKREVRHKLVTLPFYSVFDNLAYQIQGSRVVLLGQVTRPSLKLDAEAAVKKIEGVEGVTNRIEVLPVSINDDRLRRAVYHAIYGHTSFERYSIQAVPPIHIIIKHGHVRLEGVVASQTERNIANIQANTVAGVFSVTNRLWVEK
jgi:hyperosmotically inducible protein